MPNGAIIKVVPGGIKNPNGMDVPLPPPPPAPKPRRGRERDPFRWRRTSATPEGVTVNSASFTLGQPKPPAYIMGIYRLDYNGDSRKAPGQNVWNAQGGTLLADQPMNGAGPWFSGLRPQWHRQQLSDMRRAGIEVALLRTRPDDALLPRELDAFITALKDMKAAGMDYPLVGVDATAGQPDLDLIYAHIPAEFRALSEIPGAGKAGVLVYDLSLGTDAKKTLADGTAVARLFYNSGVASVSPGRVDKNGVVSRKGGRTYDTAWQVAMVSTPDEVVVDSWNDFSARNRDRRLAPVRRAVRRRHPRRRHRLRRHPALARQVPGPLDAAHGLPQDAVPDPDPHRECRDPALAGRRGLLRSRRAGTRTASCMTTAPRASRSPKTCCPAQALTLSVGLVARNNFGEDLEPGDYTLVFDMVQSQERWFSYAGDTPLQVPVTVIGADSGIGGTARDVYRHGDAGRGPGRGGSSDDGAGPQ